MSEQPGREATENKSLHELAERGKSLDSLAVPPPEVVPTTMSTGTGDASETGSDADPADYDG